MGKVGAGKGTQAHLLADRLGYSVFSTGDEFRRIMDEAGPLGDRVRRDYSTGLLMPDWYAQYLLTRALLRGKQEKGVVFESALRKPSEADLAEEAVSWLEEEMLVINLEVSDETSIERVRLRDRNDVLKTEEKTRIRLAEYLEHTEPALSMLRRHDKVIDIDGEPPISDIHDEIMKQITSRS